MNILKESGDYLSKYKIKLIENEIDSIEAKRIGTEVKHNGLLVAYFIPDGFYSYSAYSGVSRGNFSNAFRISGVVSFLNPDISTEILFGYMDLLCKEMFDTDKFKMDRTIILKNINKVKDGLYSVSPIVKKYFWVGIYTKMGKTDRTMDGVLYDGKTKVVMKQHNKTRRLETIARIDNAVELLMSEGNKDNTFITMRDISDESGLAQITIRKSYDLFREDINNYNVRVFDTSNYSTFLKLSNVLKISSSIKSFIIELETKMTKRKISERTELNINTVLNLWEEEYVQDALDEYNKWLKENKKLNK